MSKKSKSSTVEDSLLAAIQSQAPTNQDAAPPEVPAVAPKDKPPTRKKTRKAAAPRNRAGKPVQFWLHDEDRKLVRELAAWLAGQGLRPTDSMVIRSALRTAKTGENLLAAYREASQLDGRLKHHRKNRS